MLNGIKFWKRPLALVLASVLLMALTFVGVVEWATRELLEPTEQPLTEYTREWVESPAAHGISIRKATFRSGRSSYLIVEPAGEKPARRGFILRKQLRGKGVLLEEFGVIRADLILLHGRDGRKEGMLPIAERFCAAGFRCLIPDLPPGGFAGNEGEGSIVFDLLTEWREGSGEPVLPCGMWGLSLGGAYATRAAALESKAWFGMVIVNTFDQLDAVVQGQARRYFGFSGSWIHRAVGWNARRRKGLDMKTIAPSDWAGQVTTPVLAVHGTDDVVVPIGRGQRLFEVFASQDKQWLEVEGGGHDDVLVTPMPLYAAMSAWLLNQVDRSRHMTKR